MGAIKTRVDEVVPTRIIPGWLGLVWAKESVGAWQIWRICFGLKADEVATDAAFWAACFRSGGVEEPGAWPSGVNRTERAKRSAGAPR